MKKLAIFVLCFVAIACAVQRHTLGFSLSKISCSDLAKESIPSTQPLLPEEQEKLVKILSQPFRLASSGSECFVFFSEDGEFVLKLFKLQKGRFVYFKKGVWKPEPSVSLELPWYQRYLQCRKHRILSTFASCEIARVHLAAQTAIHYLHLTPTDNLLPPTTLLDSSHIAHLVDLNHLPFVLQKRCTPLDEVLAQKNLADTQKILLSILDLIQTRTEHGIADRDPRVRNLGMLPNGTVIALDLGSFYFDPHVRLEEQNETMMEQIREFFLHE